MKIFTIVFFLLFSFGFIQTVYAVDNLSAVCQGGKYDYCSQAPKCGEFADKSYQWYMDNISRNIFVMEIFQYCQERNCDGYVPFCCYEMARLKDKDMCAGYDTLYCMPSQCDQAPGSYGKNCAHGSNYWCKERRGLDAKNIAIIPLSQRSPNDVLFHQIDLSEKAKTQVAQKYPDLWNKYLQSKQGGGNSVPVTAIPTSSPNNPPPADDIIPTNPSENNPPTQPPAYHPTTSPGNTIPPTRTPYITQRQMPPAQKVTPQITYATSQIGQNNQSRQITPIITKAPPVNPLAPISSAKEAIIGKTKEVSVRFYKFLLTVTENYLP